MGQTVGDFLLERVSEWGIRRIYGFPGDGINGLMGAMARMDDQFDYIRVRHEEMSAFMAGGHAKFTGEVGVCMATSGPGAIHLLNGLYDAKMDHVPVVAIVGQQASSSLGSDYQQEVDLPTLFKDVAGAYVETIFNPAQVRHVVDRAFRIAAAERTITCIIVPNDVQEMDAVESPPRSHGNVYSGIGHATSRPTPTDEEIARAAAVLNEGEKVAILVGAGALGATDEVIKVANLLGAGVAKALLGKAALPDDLPFVTGSIGLLGTRASWDMMQDCDTLLLVGTTFPYVEFLPKEGQARAVQIDIQPRNFNLRYPTEVNLVGDSAEVLERLAGHLTSKRDDKWRKTIEDNVVSWWREIEAEAMEDANPINPQRVFWELSPLLPDGVILCGDSGSHTNWYARDIKMRRGMMGSVSGKLATMGSGVPYALAAKMAYPDRPVLAMVGDGAMQMNGSAELVTVKQYWERWSDPRFIVMVLVNHDLNQVTWEQRALAGDPKYEAAQDVIEFPYAEYGILLGFKGIRVERPEDIVAGWKEALAADRPCVIEFIADANVPPLPPHITWSQAKSYMTALFKGDPEQSGIIRQSAKQMMDKVLPHRESDREPKSIVMLDRPRVDRVEVDVYTVPTDFPEADGTISWSSTTLVLATVHAGGRVGIGYTYAHKAAAVLIRDELADVVVGMDALDVPAGWQAMVNAVRNLGRPGEALMAIAAVDHALWDLKARLLDVSLIDLLGRARDATLVYGSGGFTSYPVERLQEQLAGWVDSGIDHVKMKVGSDPHADPGRVQAARQAVGADTVLMVDGNGAYRRKQALALAERFAEEKVTWFEEPVSSDDLEGLRLIRDRAPPGMAITAGEYGWDIWYFRRMLEAGAVDVLQVDTTRCGGFSGFMQASVLCRAHGVPLSAHTAPTLHGHICAALQDVWHIEYFHDHARIEEMLFDGFLRPEQGMLRPDPSRPGLGLALKRADAEKYHV